jgi:hypothetical protein
VLAAFLVNASFLLQHRPFLKDNLEIHRFGNGGFIV